MGGVTSALPAGLDAPERLLLSKRSAWTFDDLVRLPEDGRRYEVLEGALVVSATPSRAHAFAVLTLRRALEAHRPAGVALVEVVGLRAGDGGLDGYVSDLLALPEALLRRDSGWQQSPTEVLLAVEVVSRSSRTRDRIVKPAGYARDGLPLLWCVEPSEPAVYCYRLQSGGYVEAAVAHGSEPLELTEPWPVTLVAADLVA